MKRLSSLIDATSSDISPTSSYSPAAPPPPPLPPVTPRRRQLHPTIRAAIERYRQSQLHHVVPVVKQSLPDERSAWGGGRGVREGGREGGKGELPSPSLPGCVSVSAALEMSRKVLAEEGQRRELLEEIQSFDHTHLRLVETVVANSLPSASSKRGSMENMAALHTTPPPFPSLPSLPLPSPPLLLPPPLHLSSYRAGETANGRGADHSTGE